MNRLYYISFSAGIDRDEVIKLLESNKSISNWFYNIPSSLFVVSNLWSNEIVKLLRNHFGDHHLMIVIEITKNTNFTAYLPDEHLPIIKNIIGLP